MEKKNVLNWLSNKKFWLAMGALITIICLVFNIIGWNEFRQEVEDSNKDLLKLDFSVEVKGQSIYIDGDEVYKFLPVPGGTITVNDSSSSRTISVNSFMLGEIPVSSRLQAYIVDKIKVPDGSAEKILDYPSKEGSKENWLELIATLNKITGHKFRLPTNDEWEYAARGGKSSLKYKYAGSNNIDTVANYKENCKGLAYFRLRSKLPNELGFYDMSGGVWELTSTKIEEAFPIIKLQNTMVEKAKDENPELYERIKIYKDALISRGGNYDSPAKECELNFLSSTFRHKTGARLVMEY